MKTHTIANDQLADKGYCWEAKDVRIHVAGLPGGFAVGCIRRGDEGRKVTQGPLVPGPWAYAFGLASVIAANPEHGTWGDVQRARAAGLLIEAEIGDQLVIDDVTYVIAPDHNQNIKLVVVAQS